jgi:hypothetical protein
MNTSQLKKGRDFSDGPAASALRFPMVEVRVKVPFNLGFGRVAQIGEVVEVRSDDATWLTSERCGAWAERVAAFIDAAAKTQR